jgi:hypothetical protein
MLSNSINGSYKTSISSPGFEMFLPEYSYLYTHNINPKFLNGQPYSHKPIKSNKIRISFIGTIRYINENKKLIKFFNNDQRFLLQFYGENSSLLKDFCSKNDINNVTFIEKFSPGKILDLYQETDIINNIYGNDSIEVNTALSNKLYYSLFLKVPIINSMGTYLDKLTNELRIGVSMDYNNPLFKDYLFNWYKEFHYPDEKAQQFIKKIMNDISLFDLEFSSFING